jgi:hypothetical protein
VAFCCVTYFPVCLYSIVHLLLFNRLNIFVCLSLYVPHPLYFYVCISFMRVLVVFMLFVLCLFSSTCFICFLLRVIHRRYIMSSGASRMLWCQGPISACLTISLIECIEVI